MVWWLVCSGFQGARKTAREIGCKFDCRAHHRDCRTLNTSLLVRGHTQLAAGGFPLDVVEDGLDARVRVPAYDPASILPWGCIFDVGD